MIVAILDRNMDSAKHVLDLMGPRAHRAMVVRADIVNQDSLRQAAESSKARFGTVPGLLNTARGNKPKPPSATTSIFSICLPMLCAECLT